jgi:hypothetical protein
MSTVRTRDVQRRDGHPAGALHRRGRLLDKRTEISTECGDGDRERAEKALADYIHRKYESPKGPCGPDQMSIERALVIYGREHAAHVAAPRKVLLPSNPAHFRAFSFHIFAFRSILVHGNLGRKVVAFRP